MYRVKKFFFSRIFSNFSPAHYRVAKLLFCAHFCAFYESSPLLPFTLKSKEKLLPCAYYILPCNIIFLYPGKCHYLQLSILRIYRVHKLPHALTASTFFNNSFSQISGKNRDKSVNNGDKSEKNRYKNLYSPVTFQAVQHLHFLACVLVRVTVRVKCL